MKYADAARCAPGMLLSGMNLVLGSPRKEVSNNLKLMVSRFPARAYCADITLDFGIFINAYPTPSTALCNPAFRGRSLRSRSKAPKASYFLDF
ncbi:hypothetical protein VL10_20690 [Leclercia adecarboxylata]|nr:hypothetical protein VL10_20690 [Leclercia adecarboxylata]KMN64129.1 hypothetical protein VK95_16585 [Leclercia sp. LK8]